MEILDPAAAIDRTRRVLATEGPPGTADADLRTAVAECLLPATARLLERLTLLEGELELHRTDPVTGLPTRRSFTHQATSLLATGTTHAVVLLDVDNLKLLNDRQGHQAGDVLLAEVGRRLAAWCVPAGAVGRLGGDEFAAVVPVDAEWTGRLQELRTCLSRPVPWKATGMPLSVSLGWALADRPGRLLGDLLATADARMYQAKGVARRGRGTRVRP